MEAERRSWMRRRFLWHNWVMLGLLALALVMSLAGLLLTLLAGQMINAAAEQTMTQVFAIVGTLVSVGLHMAEFWYM